MWEDWPKYNYDVLDIPEMTSMLFGECMFCIMSFGPIFCGMPLYVFFIELEGLFLACQGKADV